jgi:hypothetical protein
MKKCGFPWTGATVVGVTGGIQRVQGLTRTGHVCGGVAVFEFCDFLEEPVGYRFWKQTECLARAVKAVTAGLSLFFRLSSLKRDRLRVSVFHTEEKLIRACAHIERKRERKQSRFSTHPLKYSSGSSRS